MEIVALSADAPRATAAGVARLKLTFTVLSDPGAAAIRALGLENLNLAMTAVPVRRMAIPTTFLLDEAGVVRWMDQAEDYRVRASPERVWQAVGAAFPPG